MIIQLFLSFIVTIFFSSACIPIVMRWGYQLKIVASKNYRTIHKKEVVRIGGYAIFISFLIGSVIFLKADAQINAILLGSFIVFLVGLYDDIHNASPILKFCVEVLAALLVIIYGGIYLRGFDFGLEGPPIIPGIITILWIVGITNAINFIDGLDGLSAGISIIVLITISCTSLTSGRTDIASLSLLLAGAILGFLFYNFHPAKIFMGDCGSLFIGFMIATISLLGFGYNTSIFFTLGAPIVVLMVPIMDTLIAIMRRMLQHKKIYKADRRHLHHNLMFRLRLGQIKSVLVLYGVTILFSLTSFFYLYDQLFGTILFILLMFAVELFVEITSMIGRKYRPMLTIINIFIQSDKLPKIKFVDEYRKNHPRRHTTVWSIIIIITLVLGITSSYYYLHIPKKVETPVAVSIPYVNDGKNGLLKVIYRQLEQAFQSHQKDEECKLVASYFICDFLTFKGRGLDEVGGMSYVYPGYQESLKKYALEVRNNYPDVEIVNYEVISFSPSKMKVVADKQYNNYYTILISYHYNKRITDISTSVNIIVMQEDNRFYVVGVDQV